MMATSRQKHILIVEDDPHILESLRDLLEMEGYVISCATNGKEALGALRAAAKKPGLILLDLMMPVMDGFQFCEEQIRDSDLASIPVVIMSAAGRVKEEDVRQTAARAFLKKPLSLDLILDTINRHCS